VTLGKNDCADAERLVRRYLADELVLSFVPDPRQRLWRAWSRSQQALTRDRVRLHNRVEALLEEMCLKLSSVVSDLLGVSARRMLTALAEGETDPAKLAAMAEPEWRATPEQLCDALRAAPSIYPSYRQLLKQYLERIKMQDRHEAELEQELAAALKPHEDAVVRLAKAPGGVFDAAADFTSPPPFVGTIAYGPRRAVTSVVYSASVKLESSLWISWGIGSSWRSLAFARTNCRPCWCEPRRE
jgi:hypothetical protein